MLELVRRDMILYAKVLMNLRLPIKYQNKVFNVGEKVELLLPEEVMEILTKNGNITLWDGNKFIKLNLGQFYGIMQRKDYRVIEFIEPKKEEPKVEVKFKKEEPKVEVKPEPKKEEPKVEVEAKPENKNQQKQNENKKQRHNNNNNNNKQQGGGK